ncbi:MAG: TIGR04222 domain-containing membrane protein [Magnetococcales bacterium]|nr:TIGR04222 domain-containing membrane protein [Magnetococcales bacterium]
MIHELTIGGGSAYGLLRATPRFVMRQLRPLPDPRELPPLALALLRGGWKGAVQTALFEMWHQQRLAVRVENQTLWLQSLPPTPGEPRLSRLHHALWLRTRTPCALQELLQDRPLAQALAPLLESYREDLRRLELLRLPGERWESLLFFALALTLAADALRVGDPNAVLPVLAFPAVLAALLTVKPWRKEPLNRFGRRFFRHLAPRFREMRETRPRDNADSGFDAAYLAAWFGLVGMTEWMGLPWLPSGSGSPYSEATMFGGDGGAEGSGGWFDGSGVGDGGCGGDGGGDCGGGDGGGGGD